MQYNSAHGTITSRMGRRLRARSAAALVATLVSPLGAAGVEVGLTADLATGPSASSSEPSGFRSAGTDLYFATLTAGYRTDGTVAGTRPFLAGNLGDVAPLGERVIYTRHDFIGSFKPARITTVWALQGTESPQLLLDGMRTPFVGSETEQLLPFGEELLLYGAYWTPQLWLTDGTAANTRAVLDLPPAFSNPVVADPWIFLEGSHTGSSHELWRHDGTQGGAQLVTTALGGPSFRADITVATLPGGVVFFAENAVGGMRLWYLAHASADADLVADLVPSAAADSRLAAALTLGERTLLALDIASDPTPLAVHRCELWETDGTAGGTRRLAILPEPAETSSPCPRELVAVGGKVYFVYASETHGRELWVFDPSSGAGSLLTDLAVDQDGSGPVALVPFGERLAFFAEPTVRLPEGVFDPGQKFLYLTDGTAAGTRDLARFPSYLPTALAAHQGHLYFAGWDAQNGTELWRSDGTQPGTALFADLEPDAASSSPRAIRRFGEELYLLASASLPGGETASAVLVRSDGTPSGTEVVPGSPSSLVRIHGQVGGRLVVEEALVLGTRLWAFPTTGGPGTMLGEFDQALFESAVLADRVVFSGQTAQHGSELWMTDGTPAGTRLLEDLDPRVIEFPPGSHFPASSSPTSFAAHGEHVYFATLGPADVGPYLWRTNGIDVDRLAPLADVRPLLVPVGSQLFVTYAFGGSLSVLDTVSLELRELGTQSLPCCSHALPLRGRLAALTSDIAADAAVLFWSDGTEQGTYPAARLPKGSAQLLSNGRHLFFAAPTLESGNELWTSDGTDQGTRQIELVPGPAGSEPTLLGVVDGVLLFSARTAETGVELWRSDGTEAGTFLVADVYPGPASSGPDGVVALGDRVHFAATSPEHGRELFHVDRAVLDRPCASDASTQCLRQRFEVSADWLAPDTGAFGRATAVPHSDETADFWFFDADNLELAVKVLDGRALSGHHWVYYGALSDVAYWVTATDTDTGRTITYRNPAGSLCGHGDVLALPDAELFVTEAAGAVVETTAVDHRLARTDGQAEPAPCSGDDAACLAGGRFQVEVAWNDPALPGSGGAGRPLPGTEDTAAFWFFDAANVELLVKVLDGATVNGHFWVFYGALSDVGYTVRVTDTRSGAVRSYHNPQGTLCGGSDVTAFPGD